MLEHESVRTFFILFASLILATTAWANAAQAADICCADSPAGAAMRMVGDCDRAPADTEKGYPHCHTGCQVQSVTPAAPAIKATNAVVGSTLYELSAPVSVAAHDSDLTLRPPIA
jgi:hypothetical protein